MNAKIVSVKTKGERGALLVLTVENERGRVKYTISEGTYREIGCPLSEELISEDELELLAEDDERRRAMQKALSLLSYSDNNERQLTAKLIRAGFPRDAATDAVRECVRLGYIAERRQAEHLIRKYASALYGRPVIIAKLGAKGYAQRLCNEIIDELLRCGEIDFTAARARLIEKKLPEGATFEQRMKLLYRFGYGND